MSRAIDFIERINTDPELRTLVHEAGDDLDALLRVASQHGFSFSREDYLAAAKVYAEAHSNDRRELSAEELGVVAGGNCGGVSKVDN